MVDCVWRFRRAQVRVRASVLQLIVALNSRTVLPRHFVIFAFRLGPGHRQSHYPPALNAACCCRSQQGTMMEAWLVLHVKSTNNSGELCK